MTAVQVKICGIRTVEQARWAVDAGAAAVGFVFAPSPRRVTPQQAAEICRHIPPFVTRVGVFVNEDPRVIRAVARLCGLQAVQLHGEEPPGQCNLGPGLAVIKALRVGDQKPRELLAQSQQYQVDALLLDTRAGPLKGGSGVAFDWQIAARLRGQWPGNLVLAGGLYPENVVEAIRLVAPTAVDVSSGVELNGMKNHRLMLKFMAVVARLNAENLKERLDHVEARGAVSTGISGSDRGFA